MGKELNCANQASKASSRSKAIITAGGTSKPSHSKLSNRATFAIPSAARLTRRGTRQTCTSHALSIKASI
ncbi:hypothetical protein V6N13_102341 [Hibiscus sabdariffa]